MPSTKKLIIDIERLRRYFILGLFALITVFIVFEATRGAYYWSKVKGEGNLWNYGSSLNFVLAGEIALLNAVLVGYYHGQINPGKKSWTWLPWAATAVAFLFLGCDEMLCIHEKLGIMLHNKAPHLMGGFLSDNDGLVMATYMTVALGFSLLFMRRLLTNRLSRWYFAAAMAMMVLVGLFEVAPRELYISYLPFRETEELVEFYAAWAFSSAFISVAAGALSGILMQSSVPAELESESSVR
jgi:hypothetical protein